MIFQLAVEVAGNYARAIIVELIEQPIHCHGSISTCSSIHWWASGIMGVIARIWLDDNADLFSSTAQTKALRKNVELVLGNST